MNIKVGDKVRFLNDIGGGKVSKIIDRMSVMVENEFGFDVPTPIHEIVVVEAAIDYSQTKEKTTLKEEQAAEALIDVKSIFYPEVSEVAESGNNINLFYAFVPQGRAGNSDLDIYLINDSNYNVLYNIIQTDEHGQSSSYAVGVLEANVKEQIESLALANINQLPDLEFQFMFYKQGSFEVQQPEKTTLKINPVRFMRENSYKNNDFFDENAILFPLMEQNELAQKLEELSQKDFSKIARDKEKEDKKPEFSSRKAKEKAILEVDLHIHELLDDFRGLSNGEIMEVQMEHFHAKLEEAQKNQIKRVVFIHGVGNGSLKTELRKELDKKKNKYTYQDASFKDYGYGATMVFLK